MGGHLGFNFHWPVSIPDMKIEFTDSKKTGTITRGEILKPKLADMEAAMYVKPSPFSGKCMTNKSSIYWSKNFAR